MGKGKDGTKTNIVVWILEVENGNLYSVILVYICVESLL